MPRYDIKWEAQVDRYSTAFTDGTGRLLGGPTTETPMLDWMNYQVNDIHTWIYIQITSAKTNYAPIPRTLKRGVVAGILGIYYGEIEGNPDYPFNVNGYAGRPGGNYQAGGHGEGPFHNNGSHVFFARIRNFQIRKHGSGDPWQTMDPGNGQDGDTL
jgi:hypothetical protein